MKNKILILLSASILLCTLPISAQSLQTLLAKHAEAMGGIEKWKAFTSHVIVEKSERGGKTYTSTLTMKMPNKFRIDFQTEGWNRIKSYDGNEGWIIQNDTLKEMPKGEDLEMAEEAEFQGELVMAQYRGHQMEYLGEVDLKGKKVHKIKMTKSATDEQFYYLNPQTYLLEMISEFSEDVSWEGVEFKTTFADYRFIDGLLFAFKTNLYANDRLLREFETQEIQVNVPVEDWLFEKDHNIIRRNARLFSAAIVAGDVDFIVNAYTADGKIFPNNAPILEGPEELRKYWTPSPNSSSSTSYHKLIPAEIKVMGEEAYDYGYYEGKTKNADGSETSWKGKYVVVWKEVETDVWKMYLDIWNRVE